MAKFSVGGEEDGDDGPSSPRGKRKRSSFRINATVDFPSHNQQREQQGFSSDKEESENDEEETKRHRNHKIEEHVGGDDGSKRSLCSVKSCTKNVKPNASVTMFFIDPEVLDCSICCEPLSIPIFQVSSFQHLHTCSVCN